MIHDTSVHAISRDNIMYVTAWLGKGKHMPCQEMSAVRECKGKPKRDGMQRTCKRMGRPTVSPGRQLSTDLSAPSLFSPPTT
jgi:hypothetical protein